MSIPDGSDMARDRSLVDAAARGSEVAIQEFADRLRCVSRILGAQNARMGRPLSDHDLDDAVQDTIVIILSRLRTYAATGPLEGWIFRICSLEFMNVLRRRRRRRTSEFTAETVVDAGAARELQAAIEREAIYRALDEIDPDEAEAVHLKYFEGLTFTEMEGRLSVSANTLKARYYRGMQKLEQRLGQFKPIEGLP